MIGNFLKDYIIGLFYCMQPRAASLPPDGGCVEVCCNEEELNF